MNEKMIKIDNIVKRYGSFVALDHLKLEIREGEVRMAVERLLPSVVCWLF